MPGLTYDEMLGLLRVQREDIGVREAFMEHWEQDYTEVGRVAAHALHPASFMVGVELGLRLGDTLRDLAAIKEATHVES